MKRENINYLVVGAFVLIMFVTFLVVLYQITGRTGPTDTYYVNYSNVTGVKYGTPVLYEGYQVGQVVNIKPVREGGSTRYDLTLNISKGWAIPSDSIASLIASGLLSAITVEIKEGESSTILNPGEYLEGREAVGIFEAVNEVAGELQTLSRDSIKPLINNLNEQINSLSSDLRDLTNNSIRPLVDNVNQKLDQQVFADLDKLLDNLNDGSERMLQLLNDSNLNSLNQFMGNMETASTTLNGLLDRIEETRAAMNGVLIDIDRLVVDNQENIKGSVDDLRKSLDVVSQNINAIVYHMEGSARNVHELSRQLRENPGLILKGSPQPDKEETQ
jgi:phospholipid/cholesterol/gamma-HCH transport system substrate-binding protein